jgi:ribosomal protein S4E
MKYMKFAPFLLIAALNAFAGSSTENNAPIIKVASAQGFTFLKTTNPNLVSKCGGNGGWMRLPDNAMTATVLTQLAQGKIINSVTVETAAQAYAISEGGISSASVCRVDWIEFSLP